MKKILLGSYILVLFSTLISCTNSSNTTKPATFSSTLISDSANLWWARAFSDVDGDGILDIALIDNNGSGGWLGYLKGRTDGEPWETIVVAETAPDGNTFAAGDLEVADFDGDGDTDLLAVSHTGEWDGGSNAATLYWFEQTDTGWIPQVIGTTPSFPKDISIGDLNNDGSPEVITATFDAATLSVFTNRNGYKKAWDLEIHNLHEGMDIGDIDGDGWIDISTNGYWLRNPGSVDQAWSAEPIDEIWHNQNEEHWSRNATKTVCKDVDGDGWAEVFISHSEKPSYPVVQYDLENGAWIKTIILDELSAAHNLQVVDTDLDGDYEVLTGINRHRLMGIAEETGTLEPTDFPVMIMHQNGNEWEQQIISNEGSYNLLIGDLEGDGDIDLVRLTSHDRKDMWLMKNELNN